jgi:dihydroorotate dehydrogenase electron transfer subunit
MFQVKAKLIYNNKVTEKYFHCVVCAPQIASFARPGQFVNIKASDCCEPLLRRPFGIHKVNGRNIEILYEVIGKGTEILSQKRAGAYLDIIGPLGHGFDYASGAKRHTQPILVAGGMGVAPLLFLAERLAYRKNKAIKLSAKRYPLNAIVLIGAKTKKQIICEEKFKDLGFKVEIATDDGSRGFKGYASDLLKNLLSVIGYRLSAIYACGPRPMLEKIAFISKQYNIPAQISLEEHLACGIGACLGCAVNTSHGFKRVCKDGPIFNAQDIF